MNYFQNSVKIYWRFKSWLLKLAVNNLEKYRSGHNGADSKSVCPHGHVGSNPTVSAKNESYILVLLIGLKCSFFIIYGFAKTDVKFQPNIHKHNITFGGINHEKRCTFST